MIHNMLEENFNDEKYEFDIQYSLESYQNEDDNYHLIPDFYLKEIEYKNYKAFSSHKLIPDRKFNCFIGSNGTGKSTTLETLQLIFQKFNGKTEDQIKNYLKKSIRTGEENFNIKAVFKCGEDEYSIELDQSGFIKEHPESIKPHLYRLCYLSGFDKEINQLNLLKSKWEDFKKIFENITGYQIFQEESIFEMGDANDYILGFWVEKPNETIYYSQCSAGEKKVIKSITTLLNMEFTPKIILIDNVEMHIEQDRHISLINSLQETFPNSQFFVTTHSHKISRYLFNTGKLVDLRQVQLGISTPKFFLMDELNDLENKLMSIKGLQKSYMDVCLEDLKLLKDELSTIKKNNFKTESKDEEVILLINKIKKTACVINSLFLEYVSVKI